MDVLSHFLIPIKGLKDGKHLLQFDIDDNFFQHFENDEINNGHFSVDLELEKKPGVSELLFHFEGFSRMPCDRCLEEIKLPISGDFKLLLKYGDEESNEEVIYIDPETPNFSVAKLIYEYILLSIPMIKVYNCEDDDPRPCNIEVLEKLENEADQAEKSNAVWDALKDINFEEN